MPEEMSESFICPITGNAFVTPVITRDGHTYEEDAIRQWFALGHRTSPLTNLPLRSTALVPNLTLRRAMDEEASRKRKREGEEKKTLSNFEAHLARTIRAWGDQDGLSPWLVKVRAQ